MAGVPQSCQPWEPLGLLSGTTSASVARHRRVAIGLGAAACVILMAAVVRTACRQQAANVGALDRTTELNSKGAGSDWVYRGMVPPDGKLYLSMVPEHGARIDAQVAKLGGFKVPIWCTFLNIQFRSLPGHVESLLEQAAQEGGMVMLTAMPAHGLRSVGWKTAWRLAKVCSNFEKRGGSGCIVRFGHEMNAHWYPWSQQPKLYIEKFRLISRALRKATKHSGMMWAPNAGTGYPWPGGDGHVQHGTEDFRLLDTNHDGVLDSRDDMYGPYYPGDEHVDWAGLSLYFFGLKPPWRENEVPEAGMFIDKVTGQYRGPSGAHFQKPVLNFYAAYCGPDSKHQKPFAIAETGSFFNLHDDHNSIEQELEIKRAWWKQVFGEDAQSMFPKMKLVNWFDVLKIAREDRSVVIDWRITGKTAISTAFVKDVLRQPGSNERLLEAGDLQAAAQRAAAEALLQSS